MFLLTPMPTATPRPQPRHTPPPTEPDAERRDRQLAYFRELAELNMQAARIAAAEIDAAHASGQPGATAAPTLDLARATRAVTLVVSHENRVVNGEHTRSSRAPHARTTTADPRRAVLRQPLQAAVDAAPQSDRAHLRRDLDSAIDDALADDPDAETPLIDHLMAITEEFGIALDPAKLSDEILGIEPRPRHPPPGHQNPSHQPPDG